MSNFPTSGRTGADLRRTVGTMRADAVEIILSNTAGAQLFAVFEQARTTGASLENMDDVRNAMLAETPVGALGTGMKLAGIVFSFVEQCKIIADMTFVSRADVDQMMTRMMAVAEDVKIEAAELLDGMSYQDVVTTAASLATHLAATERQLPRIVTYDMPDNLPSLVLANRFYADPSRGDELVDENKIVHPAFFPNRVMALSE